MHLKTLRRRPQVSAYLAFGYYGYYYYHYYYYYYYYQGRFYGGVGEGGCPRPPNEKCGPPFWPSLPRLSLK